MNCTVINSLSTLSKVRDAFRITNFLICIAFMILCAFPMYRLARERLTLYMLISKLFPGILLILSLIISFPSTDFFIPNFVMNFVTTIALNCQRYGNLCIRLHYVVMAVNRAHAVLFPFNYAQNITKKKIFVQCGIIHLLSIILIPFYKYVFFNGWPYLVVTCLFYLAIVIRLAWIKAQKLRWNNSGTEVATAQNPLDKESARITVLCIAVQIHAICFVFLGNLTITPWYTLLTICVNYDPILQQLYYPINAFISLYYITDELFLLAVCKDMRVQIARMLRKMFMPFRRRGTQTMTVQTVHTNYSSRMRHNANASIRPARGGN